MERNKWKVCAVWIAVVLGAGIANADSIYRELFTQEISGTTDTMAKHGWAAHEGTNGAVWTYPNIGAFGTAWDGGPLNSSPLNSTEGDPGFFYIYAHTDKDSFLHTSEYSFEMANWTNLKFSMRHNGTRADDVRAAIEVAGNWYVSDAVTIEAAAGWAAAKIWIVEASNTTWYALDFTPGTTMMIGSSTALPTNGTVGGFGFYVDAQDAGSIRYDNFILVGDRIPGTEETTTVYQELWSNASGGTRYFNTSLYGWRQYAWQGQDGLGWKGIADDCAVAGGAGGAGIPPGGSINSDPLDPDGSIGYVYSYAYDLVPREQILFQDEYTLNVEDLPRMFFEWEYKNKFKYQKYRALIAVAPTPLLSGWDIDDVDWYATEILLDTSEAEDWRYTGNLFLGSATWYNVNVVEGSDISIGSATNAPTSGYIVGSGVYVDHKTGHHRFDDFAVKVLPKEPPPPIGDIAVEYLGSSALSLTWNTTNGYDYTLWERGDLALGAWSTNQSGIPGGEISVTVTTTVNSAKTFYKVTSE